MSAALISVVVIESLLLVGIASYWIYTRFFEGENGGRRGEAGQALPPAAQSRYMSLQKPQMPQATPIQAVPKPPQLVYGN